MSNHLRKPQLAGYHIDWIIRTRDEDPDVGGYDFKRTEVKGLLKYNSCEESILETEEKTIGIIEIIKYHLHYIGNLSGGRRVLRDIMDIEEEDDILDNILMDPSLTKETVGDLLIIEKVEIEESHRGKNLGLWLIEAADTVFNSYMSLCIIRPRPLYTRNLMVWNLEQKISQEIKFARGKEKLQKYFSRLGFKVHNGSSYMIRWNGYVQPSLDFVMNPKFDIQQGMARKKQFETTEHKK